MKKITFNLSGLHCSSCKTLVETEIASLPGVKKIIVLFDQERAGVKYDESLTDLDKIFSKIKELGYKPELLEITSSGKMALNKNLLGTIIFIFVFVLGFFLIRAFNGWELLSSLNEKHLSLWLIFFIGILASFHCVGMCGGFVIAYTTNQKRKEEAAAAPEYLQADRGQASEAKPKHNIHLQYNLGRFISYTIVGGILGGFGSFFGLNPDFSGMLLLLAGIFMVLMGLSLATGIKWFDKIKLQTPEFIAKFIFKNRQERKPKGPFLIGLLTSFMPCGPLQAMQLYALVTGSWFFGALTMAIYSLGTIPLMFGFGKFISLLTQSRMRQFLKISGVIVIILGLFTLSRGLSTFGALTIPLFKHRAAIEKISEEKKYQDVEMTVSYSGYKPNIISIKKGLPVRWTIHGQGLSGCTNAIIIYNGAQQIKKDLSKGDTIIEFTPAEQAEIKFSCGMKMIWGKFIVQ